MNHDIYIALYCVEIASFQNFIEKLRVWLRRPRHALVTGVLTQPTGRPIYRSLPMMMALTLIIMGIPKNYYI